MWTRSGREGWGAPGRGRGGRARRLLRPLGPAPEAGWTGRGRWSARVQSGGPGPPPHGHAELKLGRAAARAGGRAGGGRRAGLRQLPSVSQSPAQSTEDGLVEVTC